MQTFILAHKNFKNSFEARASAWTGGSVATRKIANHSFDNLDDAIAKASELCVSSNNFEHIVVYSENFSHYNTSHTNVAEVYWDFDNNMTSTVTFPLAIAA